MTRARGPVDWRAALRRMSVPGRLQALESYMTDAGHESATGATYLRVGSAGPLRRGAHSILCRAVNNRAPATLLAPAQLRSEGGDRQGLICAYLFRPGAAPVSIDSATE